MANASRVHWYGTCMVCRRQEAVSSSPGGAQVRLVALSWLGSPCEMRMFRGLGQRLALLTPDRGCAAPSQLSRHAVHVWVDERRCRARGGIGTTELALRRPTLFDPLRGPRRRRSRPQSCSPRRAHRSRPAWPNAANSAIDTRRQGLCSGAQSSRSVCLCMFGVAQPKGGCPLVRAAGLAGRGRFRGVTHLISERRRGHRC